jgi:antitoxin component YwqK of YwqJK toxin-antitoxin module
MRMLALLAVLGASGGCGAGLHAGASRAPDQTERTSEPGDAADERICRRFQTALACPPGATPRGEVTMLSEEGSLFCIAWCERAGVKDGDYVLASLSRDGPEEQGRYAGGARQGIWRTWDRTCIPGGRCAGRRLLREEGFRGDVQHGLGRSWRGNGQLVERGDWVEGERHGVHERWHDDGRLAERGEFRRGKPVGVHESWYHTGIPSARRGYDEAGRPHGRWCHWRLDGSEIACFGMKHGTGLLREYDAEGQLVREVPMRDGREHGTVRDWAPYAGHPFGQAQYRNGKLHGRVREWQHGCLTLDATYRDDTLHGPYLKVECDEHTGRPLRSTRGTHCRGEPCGAWTDREHDGSHKRVYRYGKDGTVVAETTWHHGRVADSWDAARLQAEEHARCLRELARGGCCDPEQRPPPGARPCFNGDDGR